LLSRTNPFTVIDWHFGQSSFDVYEETGKSTLISRRLSIEEGIVRSEVLPKHSMLYQSRVVGSDKTETAQK